MRRGGSDPGTGYARGRGSRPDHAARLTCPGRTRPAAVPVTTPSTTCRAAAVVAAGRRDARVPGRASGARAGERGAPTANTRGAPERRPGAGG
ncbi:hypothetical protein GCM10009756_09470 [Pseudokineococcus marinus]